MAPPPFALFILDWNNYAMAGQRPLVSDAIDQFLSSPQHYKAAQQALRALAAKELDAKAFQQRITELVRKARVAQAFKQQVQAELSDPRRLMGGMADGIHPSDVRLVVVKDIKTRQTLEEEVERRLVRAVEEAAEDERLLELEELAAWREGRHKSSGSAAAALAATKSSPQVAAWQAQQPGSGGFDSQPDGEIQQLRDAVRGALQFAAGLKDRGPDSRALAHLQPPPPVVSVNGVRADEVIAELVASARRDRGVSHVFLASDDTDMWQLRNYGIYINGITYQYLISPAAASDPQAARLWGANDAFLHRCALLGKGKADVSRVGPAFGPVPAGLFYQDAVGTPVVGAHHEEGDDTYSERFAAFDKVRTRLIFIEGSTPRSSCGAYWSQQQQRRVCRGVLPLLLMPASGVRA